MRAAISHVIATRKGPLATLRTTLVRNLTRRSAHQHHPLPWPCGLRPVALAGRSTRMRRLSVDAKASPEDRDISGFACSAHARPTAGAEQLTWTRCSKTRSNSLTTSLFRRVFKRMLDGNQANRPRKEGRHEREGGNHRLPVRRGRRAGAGGRAAASRLGAFREGAPPTRPTRPRAAGTRT